MSTRMLSIQVGGYISLKKPEQFESFYVVPCRFGLSRVTCHQVNSTRRGAETPSARFLFVSKTVKTATPRRIALSADLINLIHFI